MGKAGRPTKADEWLTEDKLMLIEGWCRQGATLEDLSEKMHVAVSTISEWKKKYIGFSEALKNGVDVADTMVENALYIQCMNGNVTAQIFWLKNRKPHKWREKIDQDCGRPTESVVIVDDLDGEFNKSSED